MTMEDFPFDNAFESELETCQYAIDRFTKRPTDRRLSAVVDALSAYQDAFIVKASDVIFEDDEEEDAA